MKAVKSTRRFARVPAEIAISISTMANAQETSTAISQDISDVGCMFLSTKPLKVGDVIQIRFSLGAKSVEVISRVVYTTQETNRLTRVGVEFVVIHPEDAQAISVFFNLEATTAKSDGDNFETAVAEIFSFTKKT